MMPKTLIGWTAATYVVVALIIANYSHGYGYPGDVAVATGALWPIVMVKNIITGAPEALGAYQ